MVNKVLLEKELKDYYKEPLVSVKYSKNIIPDLFNEFDKYSMTEHHYNNKGEYMFCEVAHGGTNGYTLITIKRDIEYNIKHSKKVLYNARKYGGNRLHIYKDDKKCCIFIYLKDVLGVNHHIWFGNGEE